jgi:RNA-binding protein Musashi
VFVGGLAASVTSESLKIFLGRFGKVMDATVMFDRLNGRSKGFAFATFADESGVDNAMQHSGIELEGRAIEIKKAQPRGAGTQVKSFNAPGGARTSGFNATPNMGGFGGMGFDPSAMAMMYNNMAKGQGMGMGGGFDPNAMAMMYSNMMKSGWARGNTHTRHGHERRGAGHQPQHGARDGRDGRRRHGHGQHDGGHGQHDGRDG